MAFTYVYPTLVSLPRGYDCTIPIPVDQIAERLTVPNTKVEVQFRVIRDGAIEIESQLTLIFENGQLAQAFPKPFVVSDSERGSDAYGYLELEVFSEDREEIFDSQRVFGLYSIYSAEGRKGFLSDNAYKYGAPPVILQIATFKKFVDTYPVIHVDRDRDLGETILLINPYKKPILARMEADDGREIKRLRVNRESVLPVRLDQLLRDDERSWFGQIQLEANNRLVTFNIKHSLSDPAHISDHEHLDPFRGDATHMPVSQLFRQRLGKTIKRWRRARAA